MKIPPNAPFAPARFPFFYGWLIAVVATLGTLLSIPGQTMGVSVFTDHLLAVLHLSRVELSATYMVGTIASSLTLPLAGRAFDHHGARLMAVLASVGLGLALLYLTVCDTVSSHLAGLLGSDAQVLAACEFAVLALGFYMIRFWGQGVLTMVSRAMLGKWFQRRRGVVAGTSGVLISGSFALAPRILSALIEEFGWRGAWRLLAAALLLVMSSIALLLYRDNPEECGLRMDGLPPPAEAGKAQEAASMRAAGETPRAVNPAGGYDFSLSEALCSYPFWIFNWALALPAMIGTAVTFHVVDLGARVGLSEAQAVGLFPLMALFSVSTTIAGGWISDRVRVRYLLFVMVTAQAAGCLGILDLGHASGQWLLIVGFGVSGGLFALLMTIIWPRFFGRTHLGAISSVNMSVVVFASAIGPWAFAFSQEYNGDYAPAAVASAAFALACLVAALWVENPQLRLHR